MPGDGDPRILVAQGASRDFNPSLPQTVVDRAMERDVASASAEYLGRFHNDIESFISIEAVTACVSGSVLERQPQSSWRYTGFVDPSGGSSDSFTLAIAHKENGVAVLDLVREVKPPFSPETVVKEFADNLRRYRVTKVVGDRYAAEWPREQFRKHGVTYHPSERTKSEIYLELLAQINSRVVDLLDHPRLLAQLTRLERRTSRGGRDSIDHAPNAHDDVANAVAGAIVLASAVRGDGKEKRERPPALPNFDAYYHRPATTRGAPRGWLARAAGIEKEKTSWLIRNKPCSNSSNRRGGGFMPMELRLRKAAISGTARRLLTRPIQDVNCKTGQCGRRSAGRSSAGLQSPSRLTPDMSRLPVRDQCL